MGRDSFFYQISEIEKLLQIKEVIERGDSQSKSLSHLVLADVSSEHALSCLTSSWVTSSKRLMDATRSNDNSMFNADRQNFPLNEINSAT